MVGTVADSSTQNGLSSQNDYELELRAANEIVYKHSLELARLKKELEAANQQQESLLHFVSHEVKAFLTEGQNAFAGIVEGDFGEPPKKILDVAKIALEKMRAGVATVMGILDAANLKRGTIAYKYEPFDFKKAAEEIINRLMPLVFERGLTLTCACEGENAFEIEGDRDKLERHVIRNLIDNAIRYTPRGNILVTLLRTDGMLRFSVKDSGVGITPEDRARLFTEGGKGKDSLKVNVDSTGYGLFVAKSVVEAHGGKIWAESEGAEKGSTFIVELPVKVREE